MERNTKNTLARIILIAGISFAIVFVYMESMAQNWEVRSELMIVPRQNVSAYEFGRVPAENALELIASSKFSKLLSERLEAHGIETDAYVMRANIPRGSVLEVTVESLEQDTLVAKEVSQVFVQSIFFSLSKYYDLSREVEVKPIIVGVLYEQKTGQKSFASSALAAVFVAAAVEYLLRRKPLWEKHRKSFAQTLSKDTRWWKENRAENGEERAENKKEKPTQKDLKKDFHIEKDEEDGQVISSGMHFTPKNRHAIVMVPTKKSIATVDESGASTPASVHAPKQSNQGTRVASAPTNLPVATLDDLDYMKPSPVSQEQEATDNAPERGGDEDGLEKKLERGPESVVPESPKEPTEAEMKERLNKLLRDEL